MALLAGFNTANAQGTLVNGYTYQGAISTMGEVDSWTFAATNGNSIVIRIGEISQTGTFDPGITLFNPSGVQLTHNAGSSDAEIEVTATNTGTFTVNVYNNHVGTGTGTYRLTLAKSPGAITVAPGDEGGPLTNGWKHTGIIDVGDLDVWSFTATNGDNIVVLIGCTNYYPWVRIYGPDGVLLGDGRQLRAGEATFRATNSGTFTVVAASDFTGDSGGYSLTLAQIPRAYIISPGDEGGLVSPQTNYDATNDYGDEDIWTFIAYKGAGISLKVQKLGGDSSYFPRLTLYGPDGTSLGNVVNSTFNYTPTNTGTFTALVDSSDLSYAGTYRLSGTNISIGLKLLAPVLTGSNLNLSVSGGASNALCVLYATTNIAQPIALWTPTRTNLFGAGGVMAFTNLYNPAMRNQYFRLRAP